MFNNELLHSRRNAGVMCFLNTYFFMKLLIRIIYAHEFI